MPVNLFHGDPGSVCVLEAGELLHSLHMCYCVNEADLCVVAHPRINSSRQRQHPSLWSLRVFFFFQIVEMLRGGLSQ